ncbi:hypothetical protein HanIR_Chr03g0150121 [Helianthus annuus]|nr:hypothetical protein HanIR_Chr03g0150121 [Helianthus annuus]
MLTDEIGNDTAIRKAAGGEVEVCLAVGREVSLVEGGGVNVVVVSGIKDGVSEEEESCCCS